MSKYSDVKFAGKKIREVRKLTKDLINNGVKFAFKNFHEASSLERLKKSIRGGY